MNRTLCLLGLLIGFSSIPLASQAQVEPPLALLRLRAQGGGSLFGRAEYDLPATEESLPPTSTVLSTADLRCGGSALFGRRFSIDFDAGYTSWQTRYFESYGRSRSRSVHARLGPALRIPLGRSGRAPSLFVSLAAGPAFSFVPNDAAHVAVTEDISPRAGFVVSWAHGIEIPLKPNRFGLRVQLDWDFMRVSYRVRRDGPAGALPTSHFEDLLRRPVLLVGLWVQP